MKHTLTIRNQEYYIHLFYYYFKKGEDYELFLDITLGEQSITLPPITQTYEKVKAVIDFADSAHYLFEDEQKIYHHLFFMYFQEKAYEWVLSAHQKEIEENEDNGQYYVIEAHQISNNGDSFQGYVQGGLADITEDITNAEWYLSETLAQRFLNNPGKSISPSSTAMLTYKIKPFTQHEIYYLLNR